MPIVGYSRGGFSPLSLSPSLWFDADDAATITSSGGLVSQWSDKSGGGFHASASGGARPSTGVATENGRNVISFLTSAAKLDFSRPTTSNTATVFVVQRTTDTTYLILHGSEFAWVGQSGSSSTLVSMWGSPTYYKNGSLQSWTTRSTVFTALDNQAAVVTAKTVSFGSFGWVATWHLGGYAGYEFTGTIAEILIYPTALSDANRQSVEGYLRAKWGTP